MKTTKRKRCKMCKMKFDREKISIAFLAGGFMRFTCPRCGYTWNEDVDELDNLSESTNSKDKIDLSKVDRVEVIEHTDDKHGRQYVNSNVKHVFVSLQDDDKTLKIFVS